MGQDNEGFDQNELQIGFDGDKARGKFKPILRKNNPAINSLINRK